MKFFIMVPADLPYGPVKGAYALANALAAEREVTLVAVKKGAGAEAPLAENIRHICLSPEAKSFRERVSAYKALLRDAGGREKVASVSMCFSADAINVMCKAEAVTCSSVRGNLPVNYRMDYGWAGIGLALLHLNILRGFDAVTAMSVSMQKQIKRISGVQSHLIGNFVDEAALEPFRVKKTAAGPLRFAFVGSLSFRKKPHLVVDAVAQLRSEGHDAEADFIGDGPMRADLEPKIARLGLQSHLRIHGFVKQPYAHLSSADAMVLPSLSEGVPRAAMEALYLRTPVVLRDADGNSALVDGSTNGVLFENEAELPTAMLRAAELGRATVNGEDKSLLPSMFSQPRAARQYRDLMEAIA